MKNVTEIQAYVKHSIGLNVIKVVLVPL